LLCLGCGFADLFEASGAAAVRLTYQGDTVLSLGSPRPFSIVVEADGVVLRDPPLAFSISDTSVIALTPLADSVVPRQVGQAAITARLTSAILAEPYPVLVQPVRVTGGPP
jgi:hypothetical protein